MPVFPEDSNNVGYAIQDKNPVIFIEHRWLHGLAGLKEQIETTRLNKARVVRSNDLTSYVIHGYRGLKAADALAPMASMSKSWISVHFGYPRGHYCFGKQNGLLNVADTGVNTRRLCRNNNGGNTALFF